MIIKKEDNLFIIKILKENLKDFDIFNQDLIREVFQNLLIKLKSKYTINGLLDVNVYLNEDYGVMIEIEPLISYKDEIDMKIHFHIDCIFMYEINPEDLYNNKDIYYYQNKYYSIYHKIVDSPIIYKTETILKKGIKI